MSIVSSTRHFRVGHDTLAWPVRLMKLARGSVAERCNDVALDGMRHIMFSLSVLGTTRVSSSALLRVSSS